MSDATMRQEPQPEHNRSVLHVAVRLLLLAVTTLQMAFIVPVTALLVVDTGAHGDGKEYAAIAIAIMLLEIPFTIPAFILAVRGRMLGIATCLAGFSTFACVIFWVQVYAEVTTRGV